MVDSTRNTSSMDTSIFYPFSNPFTLHQSNNPIVIIVSPLLNEDNYNTWYRSMHMALRTKNKLGFVDGTILAHSSTCSNIEQWVRANDMVTSWLIHSMVLELASSIIYSGTTQAIWMDLEERFSQPNSTKPYEIKKAISDCKQRDLSIITYYTHLKILWDELTSYITIPSCSCGAAKIVIHLLQQDR